MNNNPFSAGEFYQGKLLQTVLQYSVTVFAKSETITLPQLYKTPIHIFKRFFFAYISPFLKQER
jgi:hypothetical protein